jgi:hypothetical protein
VALPSQPVNNSQSKKPSQSPDPVVIGMSVVAGLIALAFTAWACRYFKLWAKLKFAWERKAMCRQRQMRPDSEAAPILIELDQMHVQIEPVKLRPRSAGYPPMNWRRRSL